MNLLPEPCPDRESADHDFLIVGQGLAGAILAWELADRGQRVLVVDDAPEQSASKVSAGILNPVTGKRLVKSWMVDTFLPGAREFYRRMEKELGVSFFTDRTILRIYQSEEERELWWKRRDDPAYAAYLGKSHPSGGFAPEIDDPFGSFEILGVGNLEIPVFLDALGKSLAERATQVHQRFDYGELEIDASGVRWRGHSAGHVVFCEGYRLRDNPWFSWLPLNPAKGEIVTLRLDLSRADTILNRQKWVLPLGDGLARVGSTWAHEFADAGPTAAGRRGLLTALKRMLKPGKGFDVVDHEAGVRPCSHDRIPYLGAHPDHPALHVFNGFGAKGALMTPWMAHVFADFLTGATDNAGPASIVRCATS